MSGHGGDRRGTSDSSRRDKVQRRQVSSGKKTRTMGLPGRSSGPQSEPVQKEADPAAALARSDTSAEVNRWTETAMRPDLNPAPAAAVVVQRKAGGVEADGEAVHHAAAQGTSGASGTLPHLDAIQRSFGAHDVSSIAAHTDGAAANASRAMGAEAFAVGGQVAFSGSPSLHTAAHEAAHVVQQRGGVQLRGGVGEVGDTYERHADAVADKVVAGQSSESLLNEMSPGSTVSGESSVQKTEISETTDTGNQYTQRLEVLPNKIEIQLGISWQQQGTWATDEAFWEFVRSCKTTVYGYLDNKFKIVGTPRTPDQEAFELPIEFLLYDTDGYQINVFGDTNGGCSMGSAGGTIYEKTVAGAPQDPVTIAHEFGHALLGQSDEYANPALPDRPISNDHSIMGNYKSQGRAQAEYKVRHFQHILAAVAPQFAGHTCTLAAV